MLQGSAFREFSAGHLTAAIGVVDGYQALALSRSGAPVKLLRTQAHLACRILRLVLGTDAYRDKLRSNKNLSAHVGSMAPILHAAAQLSRRHQSSLVQVWSSSRFFYATEIRLCRLPIEYSLQVC